MKKTKKLLASLTVASMVATMVPASVFGAIDDTRIYGADRYLTSIEVAKKAFGAGAETAVIAAGNQANIVDALAAAPFAAQEKAPIMLTDKNDMNDRVKGALSELGVKKVYVVGAAASDAVVKELKDAGFEVEAIKGAGRVETAKAINEKLTAPAGSFVVGYNGTPDAMSVASYAAANNYAIVVANQDGTANGATGKTFVVGGTKLVKDIAGAERLAGDNRYETNKKVIDTLEYSFDTVYVANGVSLVDALVASVLAGQTDSAIALTNGKTVEADLASKISSSSKVVALGGQNAVSDAVINSVQTVQALNIVSVTALDDTNRFLEINFNRSVGSLETSDIAVQDAKSLERYGVKAVTVSKDGKKATVELFSPDDNAKILKDLRDYKVTVNADGETLSYTFNRPAFIEARVVDINVVDDEFIAFDDETGDKYTLKIAGDFEFDYEATIGEVVSLWYNKDKEVVKYTIDEAKGQYEAIEITDLDEIKLITEDKKYDVSEEEYDDTNKDKFKFFLNGVEVKIGDKVKVGDKFNFAKVGFDKSGDIEYVNAYNLKDRLIVDKVEEDDVIGIEGSGSFDAEKATIIKDGKVISLDDLKQGDLLFFYENSSEKKQRFAEVYNNTVAGEIETIYEDAIKVDGVKYNFDYKASVIEKFNVNYETGAVYLDEDGEIADLDADAAEELQAAGEVTLYLDRAGNLVYVGGELADIESNEKFAVLTDDILGYTTARDKVEIEALTEDGEEVFYDINLKDLDTIISGDDEYDIDNGGTKDWSVSLVYDTEDLDKDDNKNEVAAIKLTYNAGGKDPVLFHVTAAEGADKAADAGSLVKLHLDDNDNLEELEFFSNTKAGTLSLEAGDKYLGGYKLTSNTLLFDATEAQEKTDPEDYAVLTFGDYKGDEITSGYYITNDDQEVEAVWFGASESSDYTYDEAVVKDVDRNKDKEVVSVTVYVGGEEKTYDVDEVDDRGYRIEEGQVVVLQFDEDNTSIVKGFVTADTDAKEEVQDEYDNRYVAPATVKNVDLGTKVVTFEGGAEFKLADNGLVLDVSDPTDIEVKSLSDLRGKENVTVFRDALTGKYAKFFVYGAQEEIKEDPVTDASVTYIGGGVLQVTNLPKGAVESEYAVAIAGVGTKAISGGYATFGADLKAGNVYTANLVKLADLNKVLATKNFIAADVTLSKIAITTPASKLTYVKGETLDITGMKVTGTYSDLSEKVETITADNVSGFDSSAAVAEQTLTVTVGGKTTTYTIKITE